MTKEEAITSLEMEISYIEQGLPMSNEDAEALQEVVDYLKADWKPTATRREVAQMTEAQLAVYAQRLFDAGITGMDLDGVLHNLEATQIWLRQDLRSQDASLMARCELFNITA